MRPLEQGNQRVQERNERTLRRDGRDVSEEHVQSRHEWSRHRAYVNRNAPDNLDINNLYEDVWKPPVTREFHEETRNGMRDDYGMYNRHLMADEQYRRYDIPRIQNRPKRTKSDAAGYAMYAKVDKSSKMHQMPERRHSEIWNDEVTRSYHNESQKATKNHASNVYTRSQNVPPQSKSYAKMQTVSGYTTDTSQDSSVHYKQGQRDRHYLFPYKNQISFDTKPREENEEYYKRYITRASQEKEEKTKENSKRTNGVFVSGYETTIDVYDTSSDGSTVTDGKESRKQEKNNDIDYYRTNIEVMENRDDNKLYRLPSNGNYTTSNQAHPELLLKTKDSAENRYHRNKGEQIMSREEKGNFYMNGNAGNHINISEGGHRYRSQTLDRNNYKKPSLSPRYRTDRYGEDDKVRSSSYDQYDIKSTIVQPEEWKYRATLRREDSPQDERYENSIDRTQSMRTAGTQTDKKVIYTDEPHREKPDKAKLSKKIDRWFSFLSKDARHKPKYKSTGQLDGKKSYANGSASYYTNDRSQYRRWSPDNRDLHYSHSNEHPKHSPSILRNGRPSQRQSMNRQEDQFTQRQYEEKNGNTSVRPYEENRSSLYFRDQKQSNSPEFFRNERNEMHQQSIGRSSPGMEERMGIPPPQYSEEMRKSSPRYGPRDANINSGQAAYDKHGSRIPNNDNMHDRKSNSPRIYSYSKADHYRRARHPSPHRSNSPHQVSPRDIRSGQINSVRHPADRHKEPLYVDTRNYKTYPSQEHYYKHPSPVPREKTLERNTLNRGANSFHGHSQGAHHDERDFANGYSQANQSGPVANHVHRNDSSENFRNVYNHPEVPVRDKHHQHTRSTSHFDYDDSNGDRGNRVSMSTIDRSSRYNKNPQIPSTIPEPAGKSLKGQEPPAPPLRRPVIK